MMKSKKTQKEARFLDGPVFELGIRGLSVNVIEHDLFEIWPADILFPNYDEGDRAFWKYVAVENEGPGRYRFAGYSAWSESVDGVRFDKVPAE